MGEVTNTRKQKNPKMSGRDLEAAFKRDELPFVSEQSEPSKWEKNPLGELDLLTHKDEQADHVLDLAVSDQLPEEIMRLLHEQNSTGRELVPINTMSNNLSTALDAYYQSTGGIATQGIGHLPREAGGLEARSLPAEAERRQNWETKNVILVAVSLIGSAAFTTVCNLPSSFLITTGKWEFQAEDVITAQMPPLFNLMVFNSAVFTMCLMAILVLAWSLPFGSVVVFLSVTIGVVYAILVKNIMPKMSVRVGNDSIEGTYLVWLLALGFICAGAILCFCFSRGYQVIKRVVSEKIREFQS